MNIYIYIIIIIIKIYQKPQNYNTSYKASWLSFGGPNPKVDLGVHGKVDLEVHGERNQLKWKDAKKIVGFRIL